MDQYEKIETIGSGAFGKVCKVRRKSDNKVLVWKELNYGSMNEQEKQQLVAEVNILRELRNPFIVRYYDRIVDKKNTRLYIVMEYCAGGDLGRVIKKCRRDHCNLEESVIWRLFAQAVVALKNCHQRAENGERRPILHRDLKPANMMLDQNENLKIGDFGLAKELSSGSKLAKTNVGTPFYMSPEIINGKQYGEKSDVWSLGCLLYELAALRPPFEASNQLQLAMKINTGKFHRIPNKYSEELNSAIRSMLQVDPARRPKMETLESITGLKSALRQANSVMQEYQFQQTYSQRMKDLKAYEESLNAREESIQQKEEELKALEGKLIARERRLQQHERDAASGSGEEDRRMSIQPSEDCSSGDEDLPAPPRPAFSIFHDENVPQNQQQVQSSHLRRQQSKTIDEKAMKENVFTSCQQYQYHHQQQFQQLGKKPSSSRQPPPPPFAFKKYPHQLKEEGKGRQDKDEGSATKKPRSSRDRAALQSLVTNKPVFSAVAPMLRKQDSL